MKWMETAIMYAADASFGDTARELVCDLFYGLGVGGVVTEDLPPQNGSVRGQVKGYFYSDEAGLKKLAYLKKKVEKLTAEGRMVCNMGCCEVDDADWANAWKEHFHTRLVGEHIVIKPSWQAYQPGAEDIVIELDPGMAFGTGTHATTAMCLKMIEQYVGDGDHVLDVGTGSGVLMVAARKCGAELVWGVDNDPVAVTIARENLLLNNVAEADFSVFSAELVGGIGRRFDVVVANILTSVVIELVPALKDVMRDSGLFICSGIIEEKREAVEAALQGHGFAIEKIMHEDAWICIAARL